jgi:hypothetical protein
MLVVDLMHEFELGVWRALFIHLLRMLESMNPNLLHELDRRYVNSPYFLNLTLMKIPDIARSLPSVETRSESSHLIPRS